MEYQHNRCSSSTLLWIQSFGVEDTVWIPLFRRTNRPIDISTHYFIRESNHKEAYSLPKNSSTIRRSRNTYLCIFSRGERVDSSLLLWRGRQCRRLASNIRNSISRRFSASDSTCSPHDNTMWCLHVCRRYPPSSSQ